MIGDGKSTYDIAKEIGKGQTTVRYWLKKHGLKTNTSIKNKHQEFEEKFIDINKFDNNRKKSYSFLLGIFLGDGGIYKIKNTFRLYYSNQASYTRINKSICDNLAVLFPSKNIAVYKRSESDCVNISMGASGLDKLFPYGKGVKHLRKIEFTEEQKEIISLYPKEFIKGMIESDGSRYAPRFKECPTYFIYQFSNCSLDLHDILHFAANLIGLEFTFRKSSKKTGAPMFLTMFNKKKSVLLMDEFIGPKS